MRPEVNSRRLFGITRSKGKMYELGLPEGSHIAIPANSEPQELFVLAIATLGDVAAALSEAENVDVPLLSAIMVDLVFSANFFDAFLKSRIFEGIARDTSLLAASAYYLARRPGSSLVLARKLDIHPDASPVDKLLHWVLRARWDIYLHDEHPLFGTALANISRLLVDHFKDGSGSAELTEALNRIRSQAYTSASARDLLFIDIIAAIIRLRLAASAWTTLPEFTGIPAERWMTAIRRPEFPKELWPSQMLLGQAGLFSGTSGIVQMPTSSGKTRSVEIVLRSGFISGRSKVAVVVAPFRALCHEIGTSLRHAFREDDVKVNELSDAMQLDYLQQNAELLGVETPTSQYILVLTPEKFLYVLRQTPSFVKEIGIVVYDEGHQFDSGSRGITYELLLTEIKALLPKNAQTVLISAVIQNAQAIGEWLIGDGVKVVNGTGLLTTSRSVAFASWLERLGQLMFFESGTYDKPDYFVPRVIESQRLTKRPREKKDRFFPDNTESNDIALYLGIRLASQGAVAIFCGRKATASSITTRAIDAYERGFAIPPPSASSHPDELRRMKNLIDGHFGNESVASRAASLGVFVHHGTTPQGIRLSIEFAMKESRINFVVCTSTLAQGVNLPIRYLIVSDIRQGGEKIKVRDFQNLIGRAGRAGMYTEGLVIFSDPEIFDKRQTDSWMFDSSVQLLSPDESESITSSLLELLAPIRSRTGSVELPLNADELFKILLLDKNEWRSFANDLVKSRPDLKFEIKELVNDLKNRRHLVGAIESYLMANRGTRPFEDFKNAAEQLATATLAYHLASDELKPLISSLFSSVAEYVNQQEPSPEKQASYSKTLLGVRSAKMVERWVTENRQVLLSLKTNADWLTTTWELFSAELDDKFFHTVEPKSLPINLAQRWLQGHSYKMLFDYSRSRNGSKQWGETTRRQLTEEDIIAFCENTLGFECSLVLAAVAEFLLEENDFHEEEALPVFQKALKYGLPDWLSISCYELGFADRVLAQHLCNTVRAEGFSDTNFSHALKLHREQVKRELENFPSYFGVVLGERT